MVRLFCVWFASTSNRVPWGSVLRICVRGFITSRARNLLTFFLNWVKTNFVSHVEPRIFIIKRSRWNLVVSRSRDCLLGFFEILFHSLVSSHGKSRGPINNWTLVRIVLTRLRGIGLVFNCSTLSTEFYRRCTFLMDWSIWWLIMAWSRGLCSDCIYCFSAKRFR